MGSGEKSTIQQRARITTFYGILFALTAYYLVIIIIFVKIAISDVSIQEPHLLTAGWLIFLTYAALSDPAGNVSSLSSTYLSTAVPGAILGIFGLSDQGVRRIIWAIVFSVSLYIVISAVEFSLGGIIFFEAAGKSETITSSAIKAFADSRSGLPMPNGEILNTTEVRLAFASVMSSTKILLLSMLATLFGLLYGDEK